MLCAVPAVVVGLWCTCWVALGAGGARAQVPQTRASCPTDYGLQCAPRYHDKSRQRSHFDVNGVDVTYEYTVGGYFALQCPPSIALDEPALPRFDPALQVREVRLACPPPARARAGSYATALRALNVTALEAPASGAAAVTPGYLIMLELKNLPKMEPLALTAMPNLRALNISDMNITFTDLVLFPAGLERLRLTNTGIGSVSADSFTRLSNLTELVIKDKEPVLVEAAGNLSSLRINSPDSQVGLWLPDTLEKLELFDWAMQFPKPWLSCAGLDSLIVYGATAELLPTGWLANCTRLRVLLLSSAESLTHLAASALHGAIALQEVRFQWCALQSLPAGLLDDARELRVFEVWENHLLTIPSGLFKNQASLSELILSKNSLTDSVLSSLEYVTTLSQLDLFDNGELDACGNITSGSSPLHRLKSLTELRLDGTATRHVCPDWLQLPRLQRLDLSYTAVTRLTYADLQFNSTVDIKVGLADLHLINLVFDREDYESLVAAPAEPVVLLLLGAETSLRCDCELYWAAASMRHPHSRLRQRRASCEDGRSLDGVPLEELVCAVTGAACPAGCVCETRGDTAWPGPLLLLHCTGAGLHRVPRVDARAALAYTGVEPVALDLRLAGNRIALFGPEDLPLEVTALDLRNNSLSLIDEATMAALVSRAPRVLLAGNPLDCDCRAGAALTAMRARPDVFHDWTDITCSDGMRLATLPPCDDDETTRKPGNSKESEWGGMTRGVVVALAMGVAALVAAMLGLARLSLRRRSRVASRAQAPQILQVERRRPEPDEWSYDAFVSYAHADEAVVRELVERLEGGAEPLRLCVHYRDWVPGGWIPAQIAASVRVSRRTVAVVSEAFLRSKWARAEFREAYAAALEDAEPRLVLVLLEDPARLQLDAELRVYVSSNTYVRWGEPLFWRKLRAALPVPPARSHAAPRAPMSA